MSFVSSLDHTIDQLNLRMPNAAPDGRFRVEAALPPSSQRPYIDPSLSGRGMLEHHAIICTPQTSVDRSLCRRGMFAHHVAHLHATNIRRSIPPSSWDASELSGGTAETGVEEAFRPFSACKSFGIQASARMPSSALLSRTFPCQQRHEGLFYAVDRRWPPNGGLRANAVRATGMDVLVTRVATSLSGRRRRALGRPLHGDGV
jgi:hypothetical protein